MLTHSKSCRMRPRHWSKHILDDVQAEALFDTLPDMPENEESETLGKRLGDEKTRAIVNTLPETLPKM